jgi:hypothetical protein
MSVRPFILRFHININHASILAAGTTLIGRDQAVDHSFDKFCLIGREKLPRAWTNWNGPKLPRW